MQATEPTQSFMQQIMPYLVMVTVGVLATLGVSLPLLIKAVFAKMMTQLESNRAVAIEAAKDANTAAAAANTAATAVTEHNVMATKKLDSIEEKVNGTASAAAATLTALQAKSDQQTIDALAEKDRQIAVLTNKPTQS